jgi:PAS domain S-box-containing protein
MKDETKSKAQLINELTELRQLLAGFAELGTSEVSELKKIIDILPVGVVYLDAEFRFISANKFFYDFTGLNENDLKGKLCYETVGEYSDDSRKEGLEKICSFCKKDECFKSRKPTVMERPLGDSLIRVTTIPELGENGDVSHFLEVIEDITERRQAQTEAIRSSQLAALGELSAGVAHEINNPVNGIINYAEILKKKTVQGSKEQDIALRIIKEGDRIANLVNCLLSFAHKSEGDKKAVSIHSTISVALALTESQLKKDRIKLSIDMSQDLPPVTVLPGQIEQVFLNIISNARYALNQKDPAAQEDKIIEIRGEKVSINNKFILQITFHDNGMGIPAEVSKKLMNPFFTTKPRGIGTGLGLSISHGIINNHGGKIMINSLEGEFTKVTIQLPLS